MWSQLPSFKISVVNFKNFTNSDRKIKCPVFKNYIKIAQIFNLDLKIPVKSKYLVARNG